MNHTTRKSLLMRVKDSEDALAWSQFADLYGPLIFRYGKRKGFQDADAADLMQDVLGRVAQSIGKFDYDPSVGRFRSWLFLISRQAISGLLKKRDRQPIGTGGSRVAELIADLPAEQDESIWESDYRQHLLNWAMEKIQGQFAESTWRAFCETAINNNPAQLVADSLGMSIGAVYIAKSRVTQRLKEAVATIDDTLE
ncbi:MAG: sigma-70 family RNA polymerase sigma factor [Planctomycetota bacterium]